MTIQVRKEFAQKMALLREQTRLTGGLHHVQVLNLRMWPKILFGECESEFTWDPEKKEVSFFIQTEEGNILDFQVKEAVDHLTEWSRHMVGLDWNVLVNVNGKVYNGNPDAGTEGSSAV